MSTTIAIKYTGPLETAHVYIDDDGYDMVDCSAAGQLQLDLSVQLHDHCIASTNVIRLSSANALVPYRHNV